MKRADEILKKLMTELHFDENNSYASFFGSWEKIAGIDIANHSELQEVKNNCLFVTVDHPGWIQIIQFKKRQILASIDSQFPELEVKDIRGFYKSIS